MTTVEQPGRLGAAPTSRTTYRRRVRLCQSAIGVLALLYLVQVATPLRLHPDTVVLLSVGESVAHGNGFLFNGQPTVFPPGYPALAALLLKLRLAHNWALIGFNVISLLVGLWAVGYVLMRRIFDTIFPVLNVCLVSLLSFVFIKYSAIPLTEAGFFGLAMCCLAAMESISRVNLGRKFWLHTTASWVLLLAALAVRRVGIALIPALLWSLVSHAELRQCIRRLSNRTKIATFSGIAGACALTAWIVMDNLSVIRDRFDAVLRGHSLADAVPGVLFFRLRELSEMTLNLPITALPSAIRPVGLLAGGLALVLILQGIAITMKREISPTAVFLCSYSLVIFSWPWYDPRFWFPVIPLLTAYAGLAVKQVIVRHPSLEMFGRLYLVMFVLIGTITLGWSTMVTFSGLRFPDAYREFSKSQFPENFRPAYCAAFRSCPDGADASHVDTRVLRLLRQYN
jgi:hypothetical protein